jgi:hypothetical protein
MSLAIARAGDGETDSKVPCPVRIADHLRPIENNLRERANILATSGVQKGVRRDDGPRMSGGGGPAERPERIESRAPCVGIGPAYLWNVAERITPPWAR